MQTTRGASLSDADNSSGGGAAVSAGNGRRRRVVVLVAVAAGVLALDILSKIIVVAKLSDREPLSLLGGFLKLTVTRNPGAAFSIGTGATFLFSFIAAGVIVAIVRTARRLYSLPWAVTLGLLLGGATGNLVDRIFRSPGVFRGHVVDWIELPHYPVFNLADSAICVGGVLAVLLAARGFQLDGSRTLSKDTGKTEVASGDKAGKSEKDEDVRQKDQQEKAES